METSKELATEFLKERKRLRHTQLSLARTFNCAQSAIAAVEAGFLSYVTMEKWLQRLQSLTVVDPNRVYYTEEQIQELRAAKNATEREYRLRLKILRHAQAGKPIAHLLKGKQK